MCVWFSPQDLPPKFLILRTNERDTIKNWHTCSCKVPVILVRLYSTLHFHHKFSINSQISNFMNIRPVKSRVVPSGRRGRHDEANRRLCKILRYEHKKICTRSPTIYSIQGPPRPWKHPRESARYLSGPSVYQVWISTHHHDLTRAAPKPTPWIYFLQFIHALVFSLRGRVGRNQSPVMWPVWLWHTVS